MEEVALEAEVGRATGSAASRRLRAEGKVPAVLYGHGIEPRPLAVDRKALRTALGREVGLNALISLSLGGSRHLAMARQLQRHPVRGTVDHVDFVIVRRDEVVTAEVTIRVVGEALAVHRADGLVEQQLFSLSVQATPADIPGAIEVDISDLAIGDAVRVGDLKLPPGVSTDVDPDETVVAGQASRVAAEVEEAEEAAAAPEGEEAEPVDVGSGEPDGSREG